MALLAVSNRVNWCALMYLQKLTFFLRKWHILVIILLIAIPASLIAPDVYSTNDQPEGVIPKPADINVDGNGFLLIILDGVGTDSMLDEEMMPLLNSEKNRYSILNVRTGPLTLSATCIKELMTGVPNNPIDGLNNFNLGHPGGQDPWLMAANDETHDVAMIGSYVMGNMYSEVIGIEFTDTFKGHSDYYEGDQESFELMSDIIDSNSHNIVSLHFSGPDKVGHTWGIESEEYKDKLLDIDIKLNEIMSNIDSNWNIIITADHGMTATGTHGSAEEKTRDVSAFVTGPDIITSASQNIVQRDLAALTTLLTGQPFPLQLHGRIPIDILDYNESDKILIEEWNWEAATQRQLFFSGYEDIITDRPEIDWDSIEQDTNFEDKSSIYWTLFVWSALITLAIIAFKDQFKSPKQTVLEVISFVAFIVVLAYSQYRLDFSAMIPRAFGAACAVYLATNALCSKTNEESNSKTSIINLITSPLIMPYLFMFLFVLTGDISRSVVIGMLIWVVIYPINMLILDGNVQSKYQFSNGFFWLMALACVSFSGNRVWFLLIPLVILIGKLVVENFSKQTTKQDRIALLLLLFFTVISLLFVNSRITGFHIMSKMLTLGWSSSILIVIGSVLILLSACIIASKLIRNEINYHSISWSYGCLLIVYLAQIIESTNYDRALLSLIFSSYIFCAWQYLSNKKSPRNFYLFTLVISCHMLLVWGVWASVIGFLLLPCLEIFSNKFAKTIESQFDIYNPKIIISIAVFPWIMWVLWWTLMGQVNGVQTCYEGICPHPRELDLGRVQVRGGYVGFRNNPPTNWMIVMIAAPLTIFSTKMMYVIQSNGIMLRPYIVSQLLLILGSISLVAFSSDSPRLLFSITWNIVFALSQIIFAIFAILWSKISLYKNQSFTSITGN